MAGSSSQVGIALVSLLVHSYDDAIEFFKHKLGFTVTEDSPSLTNAGNPKRWVVIHPPGTPVGSTGVLLAQADGAEQSAMIGKQFAGRVGMFWRVDDFDATYKRLVAAGVEFTSGPRTEAYGRVAVFLDISGNKWDLLGA